MPWPARRKNKFNAQPVQADGKRFDSKAEFKRYMELKALEMAGEIAGLTVHPHYPLCVNGEQIAVYIGDFHYIENGAVVVEDVKSIATLTPECKLKLKLMKACLGIDVRLTGPIAKRRVPTRARRAA